MHARVSKIIVLTMNINAVIDVASIPFAQATCTTQVAIVAKSTNIPEPSDRKSATAMTARNVEAKR